MLPIPVVSMNLAGLLLSTWLAACAAGNRAFFRIQRLASMLRAQLAGHVLASIS
jgi:hypothetical protein